ncbi:MAG: response regulator [Hydrogenophaga sp.]|uniref:ATP-binding protein n=1 Tax=Hydrogenophaga sp. TaxID=1904254 RepID=UPI001D753149|nr:ATP-binding protein [Hydrogenophaga sp.]MBX3610968.1 response regulator [Hydrogenophaga sp.]
MTETCELVSLGLLRSCRVQMNLQTTDDWVQADPTQLKQVVINLLINACDAMDGKGAITLTVGLRQVPAANGEPSPVNLPPGHYLSLSVLDDGPGIPEDDLPRVFEPFFTTKPQEKGTGLGLSVVQGIVSRHHGAITVRNQPGAGACFEVLLPSSGTVGALLAPTPTPARKGARHLLYAEDDERVRDAWSILLQRQGWVVTPVCDGEEAWDRFQVNPDLWDLVLTDFSMPRLNGLQLAQRIRSTSAPPPMVLISAHVSDTDALKLDAVGFAAVVQKPVESEDLLKVLNEAVESHAADGPNGRGR